MEWWSWIILLWVALLSYWTGHHFGWRQRDKSIRREVRFERRPDAPAAKPSREPGVRGHARVTEAHMSQPRSYWNDRD